MLGILAVLVLAAGITLYMARSTITRPYQAWRANGQVEQSKRLMQAGKWSEAHQLALAAYGYAPSSSEVLRVLFRTSEHMRFPQAPNVAGALFMHPESSLQEKLDLLGYLDRSGNDRHFLSLLQRLDHAQRSQPDALYLMSRYLITRGRMEEAKKMLDSYRAAGGKERRFLDLYARVLLSGDASQQEQGQRLVASLMEGGDEIAKQAFNLLRDVPLKTLHPELFPSNLSEWVDKLPHPGASEKLIVALLELAREPRREDEIFRKAVSEFQESDPEILCDWLTQLQRFELILEVVDEEKGRRSVALFDHRLRALTAVRGGEAAEDWLAEPLPDASPLETWLSRAKLARLRKDRLQEQKCWKEALAVAEVDSTCGQYISVFRAAKEMQELDIACQALVKATPHPGTAFPASAEIQPLIGYLYSRDRLKDLDVINRRILQDEPGNVLLLNNAIYISLILDNPLENAAGLARELVNKWPKILGMRTTLALALRREKKFREALTLLDSPEADWSLAAPADLAIRALGFEDCGESARAEELRQRINSKQLTGSERRAFGTVIKNEGMAFDPDQHCADVRSWLAQGAYWHAHRLLEDYFSNGGTERRFRVLFAQVLLAIPYAESDPLRGQEMVAQLLDEADESARKALVLLADFPSSLIQPSIFPPGLDEWVKGLGNPSVAERIAAAKVEYLRLQDPSARERILLDLIASCGKREPAEVAALLSGLERYDLILKFLDEQLAEDSPRLRDYRLQALLKQQGPAAAQKWLDRAGSGDETPEASLSTARLRHSLGDATGTLNAFREAASLADRDQTTNHFLAIYETAMELGQLPVAIRALISASLHPQRNIPPGSELTSILTSLYASGRLDDLHTLTRTLVNQDPGNDTMRNLQAYLSLILNDPTGRALADTKDLVERHPNVLAFRTTRALALTMAEKYDEALQALPRETEAWNHASPVDLAILALTQENAGDLTAASATRALYKQEDFSITEKRAFAAAKRPLPSPQQESPHASTP